MIQTIMFQNHLKRRSRRLGACIGNSGWWVYRWKISKSNISRNNKAKKTSLVWGKVSKYKLILTSQLDRKVTVGSHEPS